MLNVQTINFMQYSELVVIQTLPQSRNDLNTHMENLVKKRKNFLLLKRSYLVLNEENNETRKKS